MCEGSSGASKNIRIRKEAHHLAVFEELVAVSATSVPKATTRTVRHLQLQVQSARPRSSTMAILPAVPKR
jgi:hypothetical protein